MCAHWDLQWEGRDPASSKTRPEEQLEYACPGFVKSLLFVVWPEESQARTVIEYELRRGGEVCVELTGVAFMVVAVCGWWCWGFGPVW
ncbi:unnamed protein product [Prunus armeniaca]|uniref:Uncharacterized protein n=1 Tax=Prunus armeniaca TaxID=36596 RepID=A0A6J5XBA4_PRUAR|nr:unnamed protein product [Prunus armeniaca]